MVEGLGLVVGDGGRLLAGAHGVATVVEVPLPAVAAPVLEGVVCVPIPVLEVVPLPAVELDAVPVPVVLPEVLQGPAIVPPVTVPGVVPGALVVVPGWLGVAPEEVPGAVVEFCDGVVVVLCEGVAVVEVPGVAVGLCEGLVLVVCEGVVPMEPVAPDEP